MTTFFAWHRKHKRKISENLKLETKIPGAFFLDFILFFNITVEEYHDFESKFYKFGKLIFNYFYVI